MQVKLLRRTGCLWHYLGSDSGGGGRGFCSHNCQLAQNQTIQNDPFNLRSLITAVKLSRRDNTFSGVTKCPWLEASTSV